MRKTELAKHIHRVGFIHVLPLQRTMGPETANI